MFDWLERLFAFTRGLPEYAQFFFYLALIFGGLTLCGIALKIWETRHKGSSLLDPRRSRRERRALKRIGITILPQWDYRFCRGWVCSQCDAPCNHPLEPDASEIEFTEAYWGIGS